VAAERFEDRLRFSAHAVRTAEYPARGLPQTQVIAGIRAVMLTPDRADRVADLVAAVRRDFEHHDRPDGSADWLNQGLELRRAARAALAALDEAAGRG
jgi:hypothetical protein